MLSREETALLLATCAYRCAMIDERGRNLHPLNYALELADAALRAGAVIHGGSRVTALETRGDSHALRTATGRLRARKVLVGTNGYTGSATSELARTLVRKAGVSGRRWNAATAPSRLLATALTAPGADRPVLTSIVITQR
jgi:glycine/D-amino acid oxidase-like deaminating enzyme